MQGVGSSRRPSSVTSTASSKTPSDVANLEARLDASRPASPAVNSFDDLSSLEVDSPTRRGSFVVEGNGQDSSAGDVKITDLLTLHHTQSVESVNDKKEHARAAHESVGAQSPDSAVAQLPEDYSISFAIHDAADQPIQMTEMASIDGETLKNVGLSGSNTDLGEVLLLAAGSTNKSSDRDYTFIQKDRTHLGMAPIPAGGKVDNNLENAKGFKSYRPAETIAKYKELLTIAQTASNYGEFTLETDNYTTSEALESNPDGYRDLTNESRLNAMSVLVNHDLNFFNLLGDAAQNEGSPLDRHGIWDVRSLEIEITNMLSREITSSYTNLSETDMCLKMNESFQDIFGKEAGIVFDTNYYSAHAALKKDEAISDGSIFSKDKHREDFDAHSLTMSLTKNAIHATDTKDEYIKRMTELLGDNHSDAISASWDKAQERQTNITKKSEDTLESLATQYNETGRVPNGIPKRFHKTFIQAASNPAPEWPGELLGCDEIEMVAMNKLYTEAMVQTQVYADDVTLLEKELSGLEKELSGLESQLEGVSGEEKGLIELQIATKKDAVSEARLNVKIGNMEQLLYANEPYLSTDTIQHVVSGIQINKGDLSKARESYYNLSSSTALMNSAIENRGDGIEKEYHHMSSKLDMFAVKGSKYLFRAANAMNEAVKIQTPNGEQPNPNFQKLNDFTKEIVDTIRGAQGSSDTKKCMLAMLSQDPRFAGDPFKFSLPEELSTIPSPVTDEFTKTLSADQKSALAAFTTEIGETLKDLQDQLLNEAMGLVYPQTAQPSSSQTNDIN